MTLRSACVVLSVLTHRILVASMSCSDIKSFKKVFKCPSGYRLASCEDVSSCTSEVCDKIGAHDIYHICGGKFDGSGYGCNLGDNKEGMCRDKDTTCNVDTL